MKPRFSNQRNAAMTLVEVLVVITVLAVLAAMFLPGNNDTYRRASRINCVSNLKQIGLAYRLWEGDNNNKYPMFVSVTNGGAMELITTGNVAACFQVMSNELSTPKILVCPADVDHVAAANFTTDFNNSRISYFVGLDVTNEINPQMILCGDDNFEIGGVPVKSGLLELSTNAPVSWTSARHHFAGNIGLADGSVQQVTTKGLQSAFQQAGLATNRLAIP
ncbi:MAG TPA: type II secretion system protein [Candidatus Dormibacteraeota bacterium]|nr:type II secretion system protein [Candidatus Dormibacteraeota bacterium]